MACTCGARRQARTLAARGNSRGAARNVVLNFGDVVECLLPFVAVLSREVLEFSRSVLVEYVAIGEKDRSYGDAEERVQFVEVPYRLWNVTVPSPMRACVL